MSFSFYTSVETYGNKILYRGIENGIRVRRKVDYFPTLFVSSDKETEYKTIHNEPVAPYKPGTLKEARDFCKLYDGVSGSKIYGQRRFQYCYISDKFENDIEWNRSQINVANIDLEVLSDRGFPEADKADWPITAITTKLWDKYHVFCYVDYVNVNDDVVTHICSDELDMLEKFLALWSSDYPDIITGWNCRAFDLPYLINRITKLMGETQAKRLSPWNYLRQSTETVMNREVMTYEISGIATWDLLLLFRKYARSGYSYDSYKLNSIGQVLLGRGKIDYSEYGSLNELYRRNPQLYVDYNLEDVRLVNDIDKKEKILDLCFTLAYDCKVNFEDIESQVRMWDILIYNHFKKTKMVLPPMSGHSKNSRYEGAYVKDPQIGMFKYVASFDIRSLYPSLILQYNLSPDTIINYSDYSEKQKSIVNQNIGISGMIEEKYDLSKLSYDNCCLTPNGQFFNNDRQGFLTDIIENMFNDRQKYKELMLSAKKELEAGVGDMDEIQNRIYKYDNLQNAKKTGLNSAYGSLGTPYFRFYDLRIAEAVTFAGQYIIQYTGKRLNKFLNKLLGTEYKDYILASDTDSLYINFEDLVLNSFNGQLPDDISKIIDFMDKICEGPIQSELEKIFNDVAKYSNAYKQKMFMKREALASKAVWTAKKRYILNVYDMEGVRLAKPKIKISGLEAIKSSTPSSCRDSIKKAIDIVMTGTEAEMINYINEFRKKFKTLPVEEISSPRSVNGLEIYKGQASLYIKGTPINTRGSLIYNNEITKRGLENKYPMIHEGEKIKYIYLKEPNPLMSDVIAFPETVPVEFELEKHIDYKVQFDKAFLDPLKIILNAIKWKSERINSLKAYSK